MNAHIRRIDAAGDAVVRTNDALAFSTDGEGRISTGLTGILTTSHTELIISQTSETSTLVESHPEHHSTHSCIGRTVRTEVSLGTALTQGNIALDLTGTIDDIVILSTKAADIVGRTVHAIGNTAQEALPSIVEESITLETVGTVVGLTTDMTELVGALHTLTNEVRLVVGTIASLTNLVGRTNQAIGVTVKTLPNTVDIESSHVAALFADSSRTTSFAVVNSTEETKPILE